MSFDLLSLPLVVLDIMFDYLPVWKIRQLACMCHELNNLKKSAFSRRRHLRLFGGTIYRKHLFMLYEDIYNINHDFDLNIRFEGETLVEQDPFGILSPDWYVRNAQQIDQLVRWFPNIRNLILVVANQWPQDCQARLFGLWPQIESLKIVNISESQLDWPRVGPQLNALTKLKHLVFSPFESEVIIAKDHLTQLLQVGRLKTFHSPSVNRDYEWINNDKRVIRSRNVWNGPELVSSLAQLDTFGVTHYDPDSGGEFTNLRVLQKIKQLHVGSYDTKTLRKWDLLNLTNLQSINISCECNLRSVLARLGALPNLNDLFLEFAISKIKIPSEQACKRWPKLPTVRRLKLKAMCDPCTFPSMAHSFPSATEMSFQLYTVHHFNTDDQVNLSGRQFVQQYTSNEYSCFHSVCTQCLEPIERTVDKFGQNIEAFIWFYNRNQHGRRELVPKFKFFTHEDEGKTRISSDYHLMD